MKSDEKRCKIVNVYVTEDRMKATKSFEYMCDLNICVGFRFRKVQGFSGSERLRGAQGIFRGLWRLGVSGG